jgi:cobaltochelatase CobN
MASTSSVNPPQGDLERDLIVALARVPRGEAAGDGSLIRALADDLKLGFDPLTANLGAQWTGPTLPSPQGEGEARPHRSATVVEHLDGQGLATKARGGKRSPDALIGRQHRAPMLWHATNTCPHHVYPSPPRRLRPEPRSQALLDLASMASSSPRVPPAHLRAAASTCCPPAATSTPSIAAPCPRQPPGSWAEVGGKPAGSPLPGPRRPAAFSVALSVWGTANMRTGGDDIAQAWRFIGARPLWDPSSLRVSGYEIIPLAKLGRPRVDVTCAFPASSATPFHRRSPCSTSAIRAIGALDEPDRREPHRRPHAHRCPA